MIAAPSTADVFRSFCPVTATVFKFLSSGSHKKRFGPFSESKEALELKQKKLLDQPYIFVEKIGRGTSFAMAEI